MKKWIASGLGVLAMLAVVGCEGGFSGGVSTPIGNPNTNVNVTTGDTNVNQNQTNTQTQTTTVTVEQGVRIGDDISTSVQIMPPPNPPPNIPPPQEVPVVPEPPADPVDVVVPPECVPVADITEDQLVAVCFTLDASISIEEVESLYFSFEGLEGAYQVSSEYLYEVSGEWCFDVEFLAELGVDPFTALGGADVAGQALGMNYELTGTFGATPIYETVIVQEGVDCTEGELPPAEQTAIADDPQVPLNETQPPA
jgi:hypothetical protein